MVPKKTTSSREIMENRGNSSLIYDILVASYLILMVLYERCSNMAELRNPLEARWNSPFDHSIAFRVFNQHFTELILDQNFAHYILIIH